ncbi:uncharacterized protein LOC124642487 [Helicoverpa zea]|uniref:uncharacterized protein LOC124642487 n=1 Tax=Helicoverpa zea TaxID=7113 RepID=UPI001F5752D0|nr:uncharacterized protein LOC124642487 [Helicoverpa zea]
MSKVVMVGYLNEPVFFVILGTIALDIINNDYNYMKTKILEQRTQAKNERLRSDLQDLLMLLENRPLRFDLLPNLPLTTKLFLNCLSFFILNIIAVLQIRTFYS